MCSYTKYFRLPAGEIVTEGAATLFFPMPRLQHCAVYLVIAQSYAVNIKEQCDQSSLMQHAMFPVRDDALLSLGDDTLEWRGDETSWPRGWGAGAAHHATAAPSPVWDEGWWNDASPCPTNDQQGLCKLCPTGDCVLKMMGDLPVKCWLASNSDGWKGKCSITKKDGWKLLITVKGKPDLLLSVVEEPEDGGAGYLGYSLPDGQVIPLHKLEKSEKEAWTKKARKNKVWANK